MPEHAREEDAVPDLSQYCVVDAAAYEWLLSDHPWAVAERTRRHAAWAVRELGDAAKARAWVDQITGRERIAAGELDNRTDGWRYGLARLAELVGPIADETQLRVTLKEAEPDDLLVARLRRELEQRRRGQGEDGYVYPAHLIGPGAAAYPPPGGTDPR
jgi:hypothetical protein